MYILCLFHFYSIFLLAKPPYFADKQKEALKHYGLKVVVILPIVALRQMCKVLVHSRSSFHRIPPNTCRGEEKFSPYRWGNQGSQRKGRCPKPARQSRRLNARAYDGCGPSQVSAQFLLWDGPHMKAGLSPGASPPFAPSLPDIPPSNTPAAPSEHRGPHRLILGRCHL